MNTNIFLLRILREMMEKEFKNPEEIFLAIWDVSPRGIFFEDQFSFYLKFVNKFLLYHASFASTEVITSKKPDNKVSHVATPQLNTQSRRKLQIL